ncbi:transcription factor jun-D-like [Echeneis naucrates]|nr:transcription factor jun-D [Echeneis naucrates]XP_029355523.1 transcription factor jun-D [Echeneis naucrates]XP_029355524.1 transcription factor jun-D [Echeneis naucrates]
MMKEDVTVNLADDTNLKPHTENIPGSPDLGLLKLGSSDLEGLIIQSQGLVTSSPTGSTFLYSKTVPDEQEFADGFVKALEDLHQQNQLDQLSRARPANSSLTLGADIGPIPVHPDLPVYTNLNGFGSGAPKTTVNYSNDPVPFPPAPAQPGAAPLKEEPQTVPDVQSFGDSPPLSPMDLDTQERIKAERKRLRNRIAASKCRRRKLERISRLEDKVKTLKTQNTDLASTASLLRDQVSQLKQKVLNHVSSGCQLLPHEVQVH